ncbi:MAG: response regulator transcription factor [Desulfobacteraceae bacterium]|jgi:DNA-binding NarL/FixJ family response regulator
MIRILVADDHAIVRQGLKQIVADTPDLVVTGEAERGREVLEKVSKDDYDVVLLDITMPDKTGLEVLEELKQIKPDLPVLILSMHPEDQYAIRAIRAGASGYVTKAGVPDELVTAIRKVSVGSKYISSSLAEKLAVYLEMGAEKPLHQVLSDREYRVMCLIASGKTVKEIAEELFLSVKTVSTYRSRVLQKMKMKNNAQLTHYCVQNQLVP